jgi:hypothetical protein
MVLSNASTAPCSKSSSSPPGAPSLYARVDGLHADLDAWLYHYNRERPHLGYRNQGRRPWEAVERFVTQTARQGRLRKHVSRVQPRYGQSPSIGRMYAGALASSLARRAFTGPRSNRLARQFGGDASRPQPLPRTLQPRASQPGSRYRRAHAEEQPMPEAAWPSTYPRGAATVRSTQALYTSRSASPTPSFADAPASPPDPWSSPRVHLGHLRSSLPAV